MRKTGKSKIEEVASPDAKHEDDNTNGNTIGDEDYPNVNKKSKRKSKGKTEEQSRHRKIIAEENEDENEASSDAGESDDGSDKGDVLSKKMKMTSKSSSAKNGDSAKRKKQAIDDIEEDKEYEVESVVGSRVLRGKRQFRIRWKGFGQEDDTWEAEEGLTCPDAIQAYLDDHPKDAEPEKNKSGKAGKLKGASKKKAKKQLAEEGDSKGQPVTEEYEVDKVEDIYIKKDGKREFLIRWKGYGKKEDTWEPEEHLHCGDLIAKFLARVDKAVSAPTKELRQSRTHTERFTLSMSGSGRRLSRRQAGKQRTRYHDAE